MSVARPRQIPEPRLETPDPTAATVENFPGPLFLWLSPGFPVGAYAFSHGLEWAIASGRVAGRDDLEHWLCDLFQQGSARNDLVLVSLAWRSTRDRDLVALKDVLDFAIALQPSAERRLETITQGNAFVTAIQASWPCQEIDALQAMRPGELAYPVVLGVAAAAHGQPLAATIEACGLAFAANLVSAALRLSLIGQTDGQRVLAAVAGVVRGAAAAVLTAGVDDIASATFISDIASLLHETQETRLFRT